MLTEDFKMIYCAMGNDYYIKIARKNGYLYGRQLPVTKSFSYPYYFTDQDWKNPRKERYLAQIKKFKPRMSTVLDIEREDQFDETMSWAEEIGDSVQYVIIIPKVQSVIERIPRKVKNAEVILGYSVPSAYGKTEIDTEAFEGWRIHLLGGTPHLQLQYADKFNIFSLDCNSHFLTAIKSERYWLGNYGVGEPLWSAINFPEGTSYFERSLKAFDLSSDNIRKAWENIYIKQYNKKRFFL